MSHFTRHFDEMLETLEATSDPRASKAVREGLRDMKAGSARLHRQFVKELHSSREL